MRGIQDVDIKSSLADLVSRDRPDVVVGQELSQKLAPPGELFTTKENLHDHSIG